MKIAYFDCLSGASGNMILGAFLDAGARRETLDATVAALGLGDAARVKVDRRQKGNIEASYVEIDILQPGPFRTVAEIDEVIARAPLDEGIRERSRLAFRLLGQAEAKAHKVPESEVRLHEAGAVDAIIDVVGSFALADDLGAEAFYASPLPLCHGTIETDHGLMPLPTPATANILEAVGAPTFYKEGRAELVTPTGAAIIGACAVFDTPEMVAERQGYGAGSNETAWPNVLRVVVGDLAERDAPTGTTIVAAVEAGASANGVPAGATAEAPPVEVPAPAPEPAALEQTALEAEPLAAPEQAAPAVEAVAAEDSAPAVEPAHGLAVETIAVLETNIDDMPPNLLAEATRAMLDAGAIEAFLTPVVMKKGRSGHVLTVLCHPAYADELAARLLRETSTLGVRVREERRLVADRRVEHLETSLGTVAVKLKLLDGRVVDAVPEHDHVAAAAQHAGIPVAEAHRVLREEARRHFVEGA